MTDTEIAGDQYVASFGKEAALGCFTAAEPIALERGASVLLRTPRGVEVGAILCPASIRQARLIGAQVRGELLRALDAVDREQLARLDNDASRLLDEARQIATTSGVGVILLDAELLFDGRHAVVQILHADADALAGYVAALESRTGITVQLANLAQADWPSRSRSITAAANPTAAAAREAVPRAAPAADAPPAAPATAASTCGSISPISATR